jgi:group I intron endonuclease
MPFVYSIKCKIEPYKEYIGQTSQDDFQIRLNGHIFEVNQGRKRHLYNAIRKYGWDQFQIEILHKFHRDGNWQERLDELEIQEIAQRGTLAPNGYNNETGGNRNKVLHEDTKELMSSVRSGEQHAMFGKHHQDETKELLRDANRKAVQQWSKDGSELIRTFGSIKEASGGDEKLAVNIGRVCNGKEGRKTAGGFHWKFVDQGDRETKTNIEFTKIQQWSFDLTTLIAEYYTIREASDKTGAGTGRISKCCKGNSRSAGGFKWKIVV